MIEMVVGMDHVVEDVTASTGLLLLTCCAYFLFLLLSGLLYNIAEGEIDRVLQFFAHDILFELNT